MKETLTILNFLMDKKNLTDKMVKKIKPFRIKGS
jgi:hypothetical protein